MRGNPDIKERDDPKEKEAKKNEKKKNNIIERVGVFLDQTVHDVPPTLITEDHGDLL